MDAGSCFTLSPVYHRNPYNRKKLFKAYMNQRQNSNFIYICSHMILTYVGNDQLKVDPFLCLCMSNFFVRLFCNYICFSKSTLNNFLTCCSRIKLLSLILNDFFFMNTALLNTVPVERICFHTIFKQFTNVIVLVH